MAENKISRSLIGATNLIFLDGSIFRVQRSSSGHKTECWAVAQTIAHTTFGSPDFEEMIGIKIQYEYWRKECPERARRIATFLREISVEVPELGIIGKE